MIINQINYGNSLSETTATSKDIAYDKIGYSSSEGKIVGTAPFEYNENYKILNAPLKLTTSSGYSGLLVETDNTSDTWNQATFPSSTLLVNLPSGLSTFDVEVVSGNLADQFVCLVKPKPLVVAF